MISIRVKYVESCVKFTRYTRAMQRVPLRFLGKSRVSEEVHYAVYNYNFATEKCENAETLQMHF